MANRRKTFANLPIAKFKLAGVAAAMLLSSADVAALGLGALEVQSNLDQPLRGVIELRTNAGDDVSSVKASIASQADFESLGIDYPGYLSDISLSLEQDGGSIMLRVDSADVIIKEPFIHFLVRVDWSGGSFLREYTALIDPPVYASESPQSVAEPKLVGTDQAYETDTFESYDIEPVDESTVVDEELANSDPFASEEPSAYEEPSAESVEEAPTVDTSEEYYEPEAVSEVAAEEPSVFDQVPENSAPAQSTDAQYGPVASGESLSVIAQELQRQFPDLSIYQIMQVMFEENQDSFISGNINGLIQGSMLNIGDLNAIRAVDVEQSKVFFRNQLADWDPSVLIADNQSTLGVGQDEYNFDSDSYSDVTSSDSSSSDISDNFQVGSGSDSEAFASDGSGDTGGGEVIALRQQISDLQTSLASSSIENQELTERISILEGQLSDMNRLMSLNVEDADLANVEATLAAQNDAAVDDFADTELVNGIDEFTDTSSTDLDLADTSEEAVVDADFVDSLLAESDVLEGSDTDIAAEGSALEPVDDGLALAEPVAAPVVTKPKPVPVKAEPSFMEKIQNALFADGLWKILAGVGAVVLGGLGLFIMRRRRADEEFEISMLSIESNSQSIGDDALQPSASISASAEQSELSGGPDKETSFLTVYSDSDAVVQADEVDPIAEADVYIAYGRDEQAEEVLLDGVASNPDRLDIKHKLLGLYHKNQNSEGFERVAEELYSQRQVLKPEVWADVCKMGKDLSASNPLFDLSPDDLAAADYVDESPAANLDSDEDLADVEPVSENAEGQADSDSIALNADLNAEESYQLQADEIEVASEILGAAALDDDQDDDADSIQLINFDDGRSEISELDEIEIDALDLDDGNSIEELSSNSESIEAASQTIEIDLNDELEIDSVEFDNSPTLMSEESIAEAEDDDDLERSVAEVQEVSDLEIDDDYDEARTQYELAKVFVDLGDEDGARKILNDIVENSENSSDVLEDARTLLGSIA